MILGSDLASVWDDARGAPRHASLPDYLTYWAARTPDASALTYVDYEADPAGSKRSITYAELDERATAVAARVSTLVSRTDRVAILAPQGLEYLVGFLGVLRAGAVAVPLFSPDLPGHGDRLIGVLADCDPACVLTAAASLPIVRKFLDDQPSASPRHLMAIDGVGDEPTQPFDKVDIAPDDVAYLQYTSGSTRFPAGVVISHGNIVTNAEQAIVALRQDLTKTITIVSWLPLFHDMGLVLVTGGSLVGGIHAVVLDPVAFLLQPSRWLSLMSQYPGAGSMAPNFAFDYCAKSISDAERATFDLSDVVGILNGAEPVSPDTLRRFYETFGPQGIGANVVRPGYGLAEATVYVAGTMDQSGVTVTEFDADLLSRGKAVPASAGDRPTTLLVACDSPTGQYVAIVDPDTRALRDDAEVGEIWVSGPNVAQGYWRKDELTERTFGQTIPDGPDVPANGRWMRTGDLGMTYGGELYITGRMKDVIIVGGRNHYPQDIETTVESAHEIIGRHRIAAFPTQVNGNEGVVIVAEITRHSRGIEWEPRAVGIAVRTAVARRHGLTIHDVVLVVPDSVPRTSSGKIARAATRDRYLAGTLPVAQPDAG